MAVHYPEKMRLRLPRGMPEALALAAGQSTTRHRQNGCARPSYAACRATACACAMEHAAAKLSPSALPRPADRQV